jgi:hypothetical protein
MNNHQTADIMTNRIEASQMGDGGMLLDGIVSELNLNHTDQKGRCGRIHHRPTCL